ncbi:MAG: hypothetical protein JSR18_12185 [Proteobacteria bacterium]|nr:hypothetical protein [Pseudomonadota bacterium]
MNRLFAALRRSTRALVACAAFACAGAQAATVLYYVDLVNPPDAVLAAAAARGDTVTTATDWTDFNTKLAGGTYALAIGLSQDSSAGPDGTTVTNYLIGGGRMIYANYALSAPYTTIFAATETSTNLTSATFSDATLAFNLTSPQTFSNPGWGTFTMGLTPQGGGTSLCTFAGGDSCAVSSSGGHALVLGWLSDTPAQRAQIMGNAMAYVLGESPIVIPERVPVTHVATPVPALSPLTLALLGLLLAGTAWATRRQVRG